MSILLIVIHVIVCIALIMIVLLQTGKGADMGAAFGGGGSQTLFGSSGASTFLSKATTIAAVVFMLTSLFLAYVSSDRSATSVITNTQTPVADTEKPEQQDQVPTPTDQPAPAETQTQNNSTTQGTATPEATQESADNPTAPAAGAESQGAEDTATE